jgi:hypothetical protein
MQRKQKRQLAVGGNFLVNGSDWQVIGEVQASKYYLSKPGKHVQKIRFAGAGNQQAFTIAH